MLCKMKRILNLWLLAVLLGGMSMSVTSCKDDNSEPSAEEQEQQAIAEQESVNTAFSVLDYLADMNNAPADFLSGRYEPTIGTADDGNAGTRVVNTNTMELAAERFADMTEADIDENTQSYTWSDERLGTMTYTKSQDGKSWATVDVNIRQMPHLQKIIFRSPEQAGDNSQFEGTAYYRFGDVVSKKNEDGMTEYWICVRPCFGPEGKENSHWVTVSPLPKKNVWAYMGSNNIAYALPTQLGDNHEHSQNFAEMLFAICYPKEWEDNIVNNPYKSIRNKGVPMFHDFSKSNLRYHRRYFWQRVQTAWNAKGTASHITGDMSQSLMELLFGQDAGSIPAMLRDADGLNLLTNGKSWNTQISNKPTLYRYRFVNGDGSQSNMHKEPIKANFLKDYHSVSEEVIKSQIKLNVMDDYTADDLGWRVPDFFGTGNRHFIIRHAKGEELASDGQEDPQEALTGVTEIYRYNKYYGINDLTKDPEILDGDFNDPQSQKLTDYTGDPHYHNGDIYMDQHDHVWIVVNSAGGQEGFTDQSPYSELVSFDGIETDGKGRATNIATRDQADRGILFLYSLYHNLRAAKQFKGTDGMAQLNNLSKYNIDPSTFFIHVTAQNGDIRQPSALGAYAFRGSNVGEQPLVRVVMNNQDKVGQYFRFYLWDKYPAIPDATTQFVTLFDDIDILLQHVADPGFVRHYAEDSYVRQPILIGDEAGEKREPRDEPDPLAKDVTNYIYNYSKWSDATYPTDMWNAPVCVFRMTAVYDRGEQFATTTVDGLQLRLVGQWVAFADDEGTFESKILTIRSYQRVIFNGYNPDRYVNGKKQPFKKWDEVWKSK